MIGAVLAFKYVNGATEKEKQYSLDFAPVKYEAKNSNPGAPSDGRGISVLAKWNKVDSGPGLALKLNRNYMSHHFINIDNYIATLVDSPSRSYELCCDSIKFKEILNIFN